MKRLALLLLAAACATAPHPPAASPPPATLVPTATASRVVLVSFDGLGADELATFGAPSLERMPLRVTRVIPVQPTVTSTTHAAILTGRGPSETGIVANVFHVPGTPNEQVMRGMEAEIGAETIVETARRAGKLVGCVVFPTVDGTSPRRTADWGLTWTKPLQPSRVIHLTRADFHGEWLPPGWTAPPPRHASFSPVMRARIESIDLAAYDTTDDQVRNYDTWYAESDGTETKLAAQRWFAATSTIDGRKTGSWSKVMTFDPALEHVTVYRGPVMRNEGYPDTYRTMIDDELGPWPGPPDEAKLRTDDGIDDATFNEQVERLSSFLTRATTLSIERMPFDLLLAYQPGVDAVEHVYRGAADGEGPRRAAFAAVDRIVSSIEGALDGNRDALVVAGDHGLAAVDTELRVNRLLQDGGFAPRWQAFAGGNVAHFYRFADPDDSDAVVKMLTDTGAFEKIERRWHPNAGDLVAYSLPNVALSSANGDAVVQPRYTGQHGGLAWHRQFHTTLGGWGRGVPAMTLDSMPQTDVAGFVCLLLECGSEAAAFKAAAAPPHSKIKPAPAETATAPRAVPRR